MRAALAFHDRFSMSLYPFTMNQAQGWRMDNAIIESALIPRPTLAAETSSIVMIQKACRHLASLCQPTVTGPTPRPLKLQAHRAERGSDAIGRPPHCLGPLRNRAQPSVRLRFVHD